MGNHSNVDAARAAPHSLERLPSPAKGTERWRYRTDQPHEAFYASGSWYTVDFVELPVVNADRLTAARNAALLSRDERRTYGTQTRQSEDGRIQRLLELPGGRRLGFVRRLEPKVYTCVRRNESGDDSHEPWEELREHWRYQTKNDWLDLFRTRHRPADRSVPLDSTLGAAWEHNGRAVDGDFYTTLEAARLVYLKTFKPRKRPGSDPEDSREWRRVA